MQSMLETLIGEMTPREVHFVHGALNEAHHAFKQTLDTLTLSGQVKGYTFYEAPQASLQVQEKGIYEGVIDINKIQAHLPLTEAEFYICGPIEMMRAVYKQLKLLKVTEEQIFYEVFGPSKKLL